MGFVDVGFELWGGLRGGRLALGVFWVIGVLERVRGGDGQCSLGLVLRGRGFGGKWTFLGRLWGAVGGESIREVHMGGFL